MNTENYRKAYTELNEIFSSALSFEVERIPSQVLDNMKSQMDIEHSWSYDYSKNLMDQDMLDETKALLIEFYARYLSPEEEREEWKKYNAICIEVIEEERAKQFGQNNIFYNPKDRLKGNPSANPVRNSNNEHEKTDNVFAENSEFNQFIAKKETESIWRKIMNSFKSSLNSFFKTKNNS